jgi:hypothetical protein
MGVFMAASRAGKNYLMSKSKEGHCNVIAGSTANYKAGEVQIIAGSTNYKSLPDKDLQQRSAMIYDKGGSTPSQRPVPKETGRTLGKFDSGSQRKEKPTDFQGEMESSYVNQWRKNK